jgi:ABC-type transport system involved in cytochrome c biogenesis permease subunit
MLKIITTWMSFGGVTLDLLSPWLISYVSPIFVLTMLTGDTLMTVGFLIMMAIPLYEMWILNQPLMAGKHEEKE